MEIKNSPKSVLESEVFKIPIKKYENDMHTKSAKEKKNEILELFTNYNHLHSKEEYEEIETILHEACQKGDLELIKIYLSETITNEFNLLSFKIDKTNRTASLFKINDKTKQITIPRTVKHDSTEYLITSITSIRNSIQIVKFSKDSAVKKIYQNAFDNSHIKEIHFPSSLKELEDGWCKDTHILKKIIISPSNGQFIFKEDKYLLGKSNQNNSEFDILLFVCRNIREISIPSNVKIISPFAFEYTINLRKVEIPPNSNLEIIGKYAFYNSRIEEINFPACLKELKEDWCSLTENLTKVTIPPSNKRFLMKDNKYLLGKSNTKQSEFDILLFACRDIEKISIPSNIKIISSYAFNYCRKLTKVEIPNNSKLEIIGSNAFAHSGIEKIFIPPTVFKISEFAFYHCSDLNKIEIPTNSNLQMIEKCAFSNTKINDIFIPSNVKIIPSGVFEECSCLTNVDIPIDSNLQTIDERAFPLSSIKEISLPASLKELKEDWCCLTENLTKVTIPPSNKRFLIKDNKYLLGKSNVKQSEFDILLFACRDIEKISIPSNIKTISSYAFNCCRKLTKVEIPNNSKLEIIGSNAFLHSGIEKIFIPPKISQICEYAFSRCENLTKVVIPENSNLQTIECGAFACSHVKSVYITSKVSKICDYAFYYCQNLQIVGISDDSKLESFKLQTFLGNPNIVIMIPSSLRKLINRYE